VSACPYCGGPRPIITLRVIDSRVAAAAVVKAIEAYEQRRLDEEEEAT
jgi:hypothetical protein